jgi:elongation factor G
MVCQQVRDMLSNAVAITLPIGKKMISRCGFSEKMKLLYGMMIRKGDFDVVAIPEEMLDEVKEYRSILIEAVADYDENLLETWKTLLQRKKSTKH